MISYYLVYSYFLFACQLLFTKRSSFYMHMGVRSCFSVTAMLIVKSFEQQNRYGNSHILQKYLHMDIKLSSAGKILFLNDHLWISSENTTFVFRLETQLFSRSCRVHVPVWRYCEHTIVKIFIESHSAVKPNRIQNVVSFIYSGMQTSTVLGGWRHILNSSLVCNSCFCHMQTLHIFIFRTLICSTILWPLGLWVLCVPLKRINITSRVF